MIGYVVREVHCFPTPGATLHIAGCGLFYLPKVMQIVVLTVAILVAFTQHVLRHVRAPI